MFWQLVLIPKKQLTSVVDQCFHLTKAVLDVESVRDGGEIHTVCIEVEGSKTLICHLSKARAMQESLDLFFKAGTKLTVYTTGSANVHLSGHLVLAEDEGKLSLGNAAPSLTPQKEAKKTPTPAKKADDSSSSKKPKQKNVQEKADKKKVPAVPASSESEDLSDDSSDMDGSDWKLSGMDATDEGDSSSDEGDDDSLGVEIDTDDDEIDTDDTDDDDDVDENEVEVKKAKPEKEKKKDKSLKRKSADNTPNKQNALLNGRTPDVQNGVKKSKPGTPQQNASKKDSQAASTSGVKTPTDPGKKQVVEGGVIVEDLKVGTGPVAKNGKTVIMFYVGRLKTNNKVFDKNQSAPGLKFRLGRGEVIKGWDYGISGMKVGGKRKIVVPPSMAYGQKGNLPVIPPNSTLIFEVELKSVS